MASSTINTGHPTNNMFDDNKGTYWHSIQNEVGSGGYHWLKVTFNYEVLLTGVKLMLYGSSRFADRICVYSGLYYNTSNSMLGCLHKEDTYTMYELKNFKADMVRTREVFIDYNISDRGIARELEIDYMIIGK